MCTYMDSFSTYVRKWLVIETSKCPIKWTLSQTQGLTLIFDAIINMKPNSPPLPSLPMHFLRFPDPQPWPRYLCQTSLIPFLNSLLSQMAVQASLLCLKFVYDTSLAHRMFLPSKADQPIEKQPCPHGAHTPGSRLTGVDWRAALIIRGLLNHSTVNPSS